MRRSFLAASFVAFSSVCHAGAILKATQGDAHNLQPRAMDISAQADGAFAKTTITVVYANANQSDIEADFLYSAPKGSVVTGFAYWCGKERVEARIVDRERAKQIYDVATNAGGSPALVEMRGKNLFRARIRPVRAHQDLRVELKLVAPLDRENGALAWNYPIQSDTRDVTLDWLRVHVSGDKNARMESNMDAPVSDGQTWLRKYNCKPDSNLRVAWPAPEVPTSPNAPGLRATLSAEHVRDGRQPTSDGFFALDLRSPGNPKGDPQIAGISTSDIVIERPEPGLARVFGRFSRSGNATISWGDQKTLVWFPRPPADGAGEVDGLARSLWGTRRIQQLSDDPKNAPRVQLLSHRLGLPSKWTSWIALSSEERQKYDDQIRRVDLSNRAAALAHTVAVGIESNHPYSPEVLQARAGLRAIERSSFGRKIAFQEEDARKEGLKTRLKELAKIVVSRRLGLEQGGASDASTRLARLANIADADESDFLDNAQKGLRFKQMEVLKARYTQAVCDLHGDEPATQNLAHQIETLQDRYSVTDDFKTSAQLLATQTVAKTVLAEALAGREDGERAARLWDIGERFVRERGESSFDAVYYRPQIQAALDERSQTLLEEIEAGRDSSPEAERAKREIQQLYVLAPGLRGSLRNPGSREWQLDLAWRARAHETAYRLAQAQRDRPSQTEEIDALQARLEAQSSQTEHEASDFQQVEEQRLQNDQPLETARQYRLRPGDPLISLDAPKNARSVIAVLPDGTIQPLAWNEAKREWETRFDVPAYARDGQYIVRVLVVRANGVRQSFSMPFAVDTVKPRALGEVGGDGAAWNLKILSDTRTDRVTALLPWGRAELHGLSNGLFAARVAVPAQWQGHAAKVRFVVTDKAHNRTEIDLDWS